MAVLGHERQRGYLRRALSGHRRPHALLLSGPEGIGKFLVAQEAVATLLKRQSGSSIPLAIVHERAKILRNASQDWALPLERVASGVSPSLSLNEAAICLEGLAEPSRLGGKANISPLLADYRTTGGKAPVALFSLNEEAVVEKSPKRLDMEKVNKLLSVVRSADGAAGRVASRLWDMTGSTPYVGTIRITDVRENLRKELATVSGSEPTCVIIDDAHLMAPPAANSLLKLLEEPPTNCVMMLITHREHQLLPTIRSRCQTLSFGPLPESVIAEAIDNAHDLSPAERTAAIRNAHGSLRLAYQFDRKAFFRQRQEILRGFELVCRLQYEAVLVLSGALFPDERDRERRRRILEDNLFLLSLLLRDMLLLAQHRGELSQSDLLEDYQRLGGMLKPEDLIEHARLIEETSQDLQRFNLDEQLALEALVVRMLRHQA